MELKDYDEMDNDPWIADFMNPFNGIERLPLFDVLK